MKLFEIIICKFCVLGMILFVATDHAKALNYQSLSTPQLGETALSQQSSSYTPPDGLDLPSRREPGGTR